MVNKKITILLPIILIALGSVLRMVPHPANFAPIAAMALFGGVMLGNRYALLIPLVALVVGDLFIGFYSWKIMLAVYGSVMLVGLIGMFLRGRVGARLITPVRKVLLVGGGSLLGSVVFFLVTNAAVWAFGTMYPKTLAGLLQSYTMGLPFFRGTVLGDLFYTGVFFGVYALVMYYVRRDTTESSLSTQTN